MKVCRTHRVYLAAPAGWAFGRPAARPVRVASLTTLRPVGFGTPAFLQAPILKLGATTACLAWATPLDWAGALAWLVGDDLVDFADFLLAD